MVSSVTVTFNERLKNIANTAMFTHTFLFLHVQKYVYQILEMFCTKTYVKLVKSMLNRRYKCLLNVFMMFIK